MVVQHSCPCLADIEVARSGCLRLALNRQHHDDEGSSWRTPCAHRAQAVRFAHCGSGYHPPWACRVQQLRPDALLRRPALLRAGPSRHPAALLLELYASLLFSHSLNSQKAEPQTTSKRSSPPSTSAIPPSSSTSRTSGACSSCRPRCAPSFGISRRKRRIPGPSCSCTRKTLTMRTCDPTSAYDCMIIWAAGRTRGGS